MLLDDGMDMSSLSNISLVHLEGNAAVRRHVSPIQLHDFDSYIVVCDASRESDILASDSHVLATVLVLRSVEIEQQSYRTKQLFVHSEVAELQQRQRKIPCIAEVLDPRTQKTILQNKQIRDSSEFVQTNELISRMLAMVCENRHVKGILDELLSGKGATLDVVPASRYLLDKHERISFHDLVLRAQQMDEIVCGFQPHMSSSYADEPTQLNPSDKTGVYSYWGKMDLVILCEGRREKNVKRMQLACTALWQVLAHKHGRDAINEQGGGDTPAQDDEVQVIPRLEDLAMHSSFRHLKQSSHTATSSFCGRWGSMPPDTQLLQGSSDTIRRQQQRYNAVTPWLSTQAPDRRIFRRPIKARLTDLWGMTEQIEDVVAGLGLPG